MTMTNVVQFPKEVGPRDIAVANAKHRLTISVHKILGRLRRDEPLTAGEHAVLTSFAEEAADALVELGIVQTTGEQK